MVAENGREMEGEEEFPEVKVDFQVKLLVRTNLNSGCLLWLLLSLGCLNVCLEYSILFLVRFCVFERMGYPLTLPIHINELLLKKGKKKSVNPFC